MQKVKRSLFCKSLLFGLLFTAIHSGHQLFAQSGWLWQNPLPQGNMLTGINFLSSSSMLAFGHLGTIIKSTDGGSTWQTHARTSASEFYSLHFIDAMQGWATGLDLVSGRRQILKTTDGGYTWSEVFSPTAVVRSVFFLDANIGWYAGDRGEIRKTTDGGRTWNLQFKDTTLTLFKAFFLGSSRGWVVGGTSPFGKAVVLRTTDDGGSWASVSITPQLPPDNGRFKSVYFVNADTGWAVGEPRSVFRTLDGGLTWAPQSNPIIPGKTDVVFTNASTGVVVGSAGSMMKTSDGGSTWMPVYVTPGSIFQSADLSSIRFYNSSLGIVVGFGGSVYVTTNGGVQWDRKVFRNRSALTNIFFLDSNFGWAVGLDNDSNSVSSVLMKTTNGGLSWRGISIALNNWLLGVVFLDQNVGWSVGYAKYMLKSTDGGETWQNQSLNFKGYLRALRFVSSTTGWAVGDSGTILKTTDAGNSWFSQAIPDSVNLFSSSFLNESVGWVSASRGKIYKTTNGGTTWTHQNTPTAYDIFTLAFADSNTGWFAGIQGSIFKTTDGGVNWFAQSSGTKSNINYIRFLNKQTGYAFGYSGKMLKTLDGGNTWTLTKRISYDKLNAAYFLDANNGWVVGDHGTILQTSSGGGSESEIETSVEQVNSNPASFTLFQNYPNPFNPATTIEFSIPNRASVALQIYDILGRLVETLVNEELNAGVYSITWNPSRLATGLYFCRLQSGERVATKKLLLLK